MGSALVYWYTKNMQLISGTEIADRIYAELKTEIAHLHQNSSELPRIHIINASASMESKTYTQMKLKKAAELGIDADVLQFDSSVTAAEVITKIKNLQHPKQNLIMVQIPLYPSLHNARQEIMDAILPERDVDCLTSINLGKVMTDEYEVLPATVASIWEFIAEFARRDMQEVNTWIRGKRVLVINHSTLVGKPLAELLLHYGATVTIAHEFTQNLRLHTLDAELIVSATGQGRLVTPEMISAGASIIDVTSRPDPSTGKAIGDVVRNFELDNKVKYLTPVPGGVGPVTVACLMRNALTLNKQLNRSNT